MYFSWEPLLHISWYIGTQHQVSILSIEWILRQSSSSKYFSCASLFSTSRSSYFSLLSTLLKKNTKKLEKHKKLVWTLYLLGNSACSFVVCWSIFSKKKIKIDFFENKQFRNCFWASNSLDPDQARGFVGPDLDPNCLLRLSADDTSRRRVNHIFKQHILGFHSSHTQSMDVDEDSDQNLVLNAHCICQHSC